LNLSNFVQINPERPSSCPNEIFELGGREIKKAAG